ncbi:hypothetical protein [Rubrivivax rivuli]|uniref:PEP-CTERM protein-sorting domain-containing protein n=1 Tax=Rubrivivax rivuli TaxID=1862385 RepID=A0A437RLG4_9BURK|nr:hypothetical protein [Rubrivivax rivuli]RVU47641.1 hypothetical protein EOE66_07890 [Rubrivivax rivuli]
MLLSRIRAFGVMATLAGVALVAAAAPVTYVYSGNAYGQFSSSSGSGTAYTSANSFSVSVTMATALGSNFNGFVTPDAFVFTDGRLTLAHDSNPNALGRSARFRFVTDAAGNIRQWDVGVEHFFSGGAFQLRQVMDTVNIEFSPGSLTRYDRSSDALCSGAATLMTCTMSPTVVHTGAVFGSPGTWAVAGVGAPTPNSAVSEPSGLALCGLALAALGFTARRRQQRP